MGEIRERPILFSGKMIQAILAGHKTQTRRLVTVPWLGARRALPYEPYWVDTDGKLLACDEYGDYHPAERWLSGYGDPGDQLWVRETWCLAHPDYHSEEEGLRKGRPVRDGRWCHYAATDDVDMGDGLGWRPSIHMPRWASRISLEVTEVRIERLQEIGDNDAVAEGFGEERGAVGQQVRPGPRERFAELWDQINGDRWPERAAAWESNPWVWVVSFRRVVP